MVGEMSTAMSTVTVTPAELTPQVIARAQKHCRFAISALDYEDPEQAVKELGESDEGRVLILVRRVVSSFVDMNC